ncbi:hypothetical protein GCM10028808_73180 [Spirosoma migulaei]
MGVVAKVNKAGISMTSLINLIRKLPQYEEWKRAVFIRDRFQCQHCGTRNGRKIVIEADHIKALSLLVRESGIKTIEDAKVCVSLWSIDNGRTLCHSCHEKTDSYPKQFIKKGKQNANRKTPKQRAAGANY